MTFVLICWLCRKQHLSFLFSNKLRTHLLARPYGQLEQYQLYNLMPAQPNRATPQRIVWRLYCRVRPLVQHIWTVVTHALARNRDTTTLFIPPIFRCYCDKVVTSKIGNSHSALAISLNVMVSNMHLLLLVLQSQPWVSPSNQFLKKKCCVRSNCVEL